MSTIETYEWTETPPLPLACSLGDGENPDTIWKTTLQLSRGDLQTAVRHVTGKRAFRAFAEWIGPQLVDGETLAACIECMNAQAKAAGFERPE